MEDHKMKITHCCTLGNNTVGTLTEQRLYEFSEMIGTLWCCTWMLLFQQQEQDNTNEHCFKGEGADSTLVDRLEEGDILNLNATNFQNRDADTNLRHMVSQIRAACGRNQKNDCRISRIMASQYSTTLMLGRRWLRTCHPREELRYFTKHVHNLIRRKWMSFNAKKPKGRSR